MNFAIMNAAVVDTMIMPTIQRMSLVPAALISEVIVLKSVATARDGSGRFFTDVQGDTGAGTPRVLHPLSGCVESHTIVVPS